MVVVLYTINWKKKLERSMRVWVPILWRSFSGPIPGNIRSCRVLIDPADRITGR